MTLYEEVRAALDALEFRPRKSRGQNFLIHEQVIEAIVQMLDLKPDDEVLEIGPGLGFLTRRLLDRARKVRAVEIDDALVGYLRRGGLSERANFELIHGDILRVPLAEAGGRPKLKLVGNLPYSIASAVLFRVFEWRDSFSTLVLMVQKEVAARMASAPATKDYGALSVWCQIHGRITDKLIVSPEAFFPRPKVHSTVLKIELFPQPRIAPEEFASLRAVVRAAFGQRRKTLGNALSAALRRSRAEIDGLLRAQDIDPVRRGETLTVDEFIKLAGAVRSEAPATGDNREPSAVR